MLVRTMEYTRNETLAYERGLERGKADKADGFYNDSPLSGEWAGESIPELLGDLFDVYEDGEHNDSDLCDAYEAGYEKAFGL